MILIAGIFELSAKQIESFRFRNRSHVFEYALAKLVEHEKKELAKERQGMPNIRHTHQRKPLSEKQKERRRLKAEKKE